MENLHKIIPFPLSLTSKVFGVLPWCSFKNLSGKFSSLYTGTLLLMFSSSVIFFTLKCVSSNNEDHKTLGEIRKLWIDYLLLVYPAIRIVNSLPAFYISFLWMERFYTKLLHFIRINDMIMDDAAHTTLSRKQFWYGLTIYSIIAVAICPFKVVMLLNISNELLKSLNLMTFLLFPVSFFGNFAVVCVEMQFACICKAIYFRLALMNFRLRNVVNHIRIKRLSVLLDESSSQLMRNQKSLKKVGFSNFSKIEKVKNMCGKLKWSRKRAINLCKVSPIQIQCGSKTNYSFEDNELLKEITLLRFSYRHLHLSLRSVQELFGVNLLFSFCALFIMIVYFIYVEFFFNKHLEMNVFNIIYLIFGWLFHVILRFNLLLWQACQTTQEAEKTKQILPLVMGRQLDQSVKDELEMFSIEVSCSDWKITGWNFFILKPELFVWTVGGVATYLGIIVNLDGISSK